MPRPTRFSPEVRTRAVRMVVEHEAAHESGRGGPGERASHLSQRTAGASP
jgi:hypothetical protein